MANVKDIQKRIRSVRSTHKITRTMEMVSTSKFKRAVDRLTAARPYAEALGDMLGRVAAAGAADHPLLEQRPAPRRAALLLLSTNRGLCGGLNANLIKKSQSFLREWEQAGREVELHVVGRKGATYFHFIGRDLASSITDLGDRPGPEDADRLAGFLRDAFLSRRVDEVHVAYPHFKNAAEQPAVVARILPLTLPRSDDAAQGGQMIRLDFIHEPAPGELLGALLPLYLRSTFFRMLLEMAASEQGARRTAMKAATDSAQEMIDTLTLFYNKARQAQITKELLEVVSGAEALR